MDNVTHTLAGLALGRAGLDRLAPRAGLILALAANAPDLDVLAWLAGPLAYLSWHRGLTHGLLGIPLMAILPVLIARAVARGPIPWTRSYLLSLAGAATNPLLDWTNMYGVRLLAPFSPHWFHGDFVHMFDLWIWAGLALVLVWPWLARLVGSEIGAKTAPGRGLAITVLCLLTVYCGGRYLLHQRAVAVLDSRIYSGVAPWRVAALPGAVNPFRWTGIVEGENFWSFHEVNLFEEFDPTEGRVFYKPEPSPALEAARRTPEFQRYLEFAQYVHWRVTPLDTPDGARLVEAMDLRFGSPSEPRFVATAVVLAGERVASAEFRFGPREIRRR
jgi:inner membrane protein